MSLTYDQALASPSPRMAIFFRLDVTPAVRLWAGPGTCEAAIDAADGAGAPYLGFGALLNLPVLQQLVNGAADRVAFNLSGVTPRIAQLAASEQADVRNAPLMVGFGLFGADWQLIQQPSWLRRLTVDYLSVSRDQTGDQAVWTVSLSARSFLTGRRRPGLSYFTDNDQQRRSSGDKFCQWATLYSQEVSKAWPRYY